MRKYLLTFMCILTAGLMAMCGCNNGKDVEDKMDVNVKNEDGFYEIDQDVAKEIMDSEEDIVILDVRSKEEYDEGHIIGAMVIPHDEIEDLAEEMILDKDKTILVYCRSGNRSKVAAKALAEVGYTDVREFGGIITWEYETEK